MLKEVRIKLTFLCFFITGIIFLVMGLSNLSSYEHQLKKQYITTFSELFHNITYHLETEIQLDYQWLMNTEYSNNAIIHIEDGGSPLAFKGYYLRGEDRHELITLANTSIVDEGSIIPLHSKRLGSYYGASQTVATPLGQVRLTLIKDISTMPKQLLTQRCSTFFSIFLGEVAILLFSWWFVGKTLIPVEAARKKQTEFVAAASHELRSPVTVIKTSLSALERAPESRRMKFLEIAQKETTRMSRLLNDLLLLSNFDRQHMAYDFSEQDLNHFLIEIYEKYEGVAPLTGHSLKLEIEPGPSPVLKCDFHRLNQLLSILIDNALTYTPPSSSITLTSKLSKNKVHLSIIDNGPGIPVDYQEKVFDRFFSMDPSHTKKEHSGLGLSIAREIANHHHWPLTLSNTPGGGATFTLIIPC